MNAVEAARNRSLDKFNSDRASNATFSDLVFFERQGYLNMTDRGTTTRSTGSRRRFERLSDRRETPHGDTHLRTMKKTATLPNKPHSTTTRAVGDRQTGSVSATRYSTHSIGSRDDPQWGQRERWHPRAGHHRYRCHTVAGFHPTLQT